MRFEGLLKTWNDDRGFGFIEPLKGGQEIFVHIKSFPPGTGRPVQNQKLSFEVEQSSDGKKRAKNVLLARPPRSSSKSVFKPVRQWDKSGVYALCSFALIFLVVTIVWRPTLLFAVGYVLTSLACFLFYGHDKNAAEAGEWRTSEGTLLMLGMIGGWPGAIVAQQMFRHKTSKVEFQWAFWATVLLNVGAFVAATTPLIRA
jgi:uncharacterized membrane protein YsdA (DUF1294 family)/cold shock CspA family protein